MTQSFDEWFDKEYSNYGNSYKNTYDEKYDLYGSQFVDERYDAYKAGAASRQAEIDELQKNLNNALKTIEIQQRFLDDADGANKFLTSQGDELQNRIDKALYKLPWLNWKNIDGKMKGEIMDILKGKKDE